jgi:hypothetical protein
MLQEHRPYVAVPTLEIVQDDPEPILDIGIVHGHDPRYDTLDPVYRMWREESD